MEHIATHLPNPKDVKPHPRTPRSGTCEVLQTRILIGRGPGKTLEMGLRQVVPSWRSLQLQEAISNNDFRSKLPTSCECQGFSEGYVLPPALR